LGLQTMDCIPSLLTILGNILASSSNSILVGTDRRDRSALISLIQAVFKALLTPLLILIGLSARGSLDFLVWLVSTLDDPSLLRGVYGGFLLRLARKEGPVYLYADLGALAGRADVPRASASSPFTACWPDMWRGAARAVKLTSSKSFNIMDS
jgi:hypothetical protein